MPSRCLFIINSNYSTYELYLIEHINIRASPRLESSGTVPSMRSRGKHPHTAAVYLILCKLIVLFSPVISISTNTSVAAGSLSVRQEAQYGGDSWDGVQLFLEGPGGIIHLDAPSFGNNPINSVIEADTSGTYLLGTLFNGDIPESGDVDDLKCKVWPVYFNFILLVKHSHLFVCVLFLSGILERNG
jgi:hypothetical protein